MRSVKRPSAGVRPASWLACLVLSAGVAGADSITLTFDSLPSAQGWEYVSDGAPETSVFSFSNDVLRQDTTLGPNTLEYYRQVGAVTNDPYTIEVRARVLDESGNLGGDNSFGFAFTARTVEQTFGIGLGPWRIEDVLGNELSTTIDTSVFHDYRLEATFGVGYKFYVDGVLTASGPPRYSPAPNSWNNAMQLGDLTRGTGALAEVTAYSFTQFRTVQIDVKPGSDPNCFNINGHGVVPVAIFGSPDFNVADIDTSTLLFGGLKVRLRGNKGPLCGFEDSNGDGVDDLVCQFEDDASNWVAAEDTATLEGELIDGALFVAADSICVVP